MVEEEETTLSITSGPPILATVVAVPDANTRIIQTLTSKKDTVFCVLNNLSRCEPQEPLPDLQDEILIIKIKKRSFDHFPEAHWYVEAFQVLNRHAVEEWEETLGVVGYNRPKKELTVVGRSFPEATPLHLKHPWKLHQKYGVLHDFVVGTVRRMKPTFAAKHMFGCVAIVKDIWEKAESPESRVCTPSNIQVHSTCILLIVRPMMDFERSHILQNCREIDDVTLKQAELYIRDVYMAIARMEAHVSRLCVQQHTVKVNGNSFVDVFTQTYKINVFLSKGQKMQCIDSINQYTWREGVELIVKHPDTDFEAAVVIEKIETGGKMTKITLKPSTRSETYFKMLKSVGHVFDTKKKFTVGPSPSENRTVIDNLEAFFPLFYEDKEKFNTWRGASEPCTDEIPDLREKFNINGSYLDMSQTIALRTAAARKGFTCVEAPPGSGKTFLIAALIGLKQEKNCVGATNISATTNAAIDNAVEATKRHFPETRISRLFSKAAEGNLTDEMKDLSLRRQGMNYGKYVEAEKNPELGNAVAKHEKISDMLAHASDVATGVKLVQAKNGAENEIGQRFREAYKPEVFGSTCELLARSEQTTEKKVALQIKEGRIPSLEDLQRCGTHLILDEASQLPEYLALAIYVVLRMVKQFTVIGDSKQLGPFSGLGEGSFAREIINRGELGRVQQGRGTSKANLSTIYRCHPGILEILYKPIYGEVTPGVTSEARNLAAVKGLPTAKDEDNSPVLFVQVDGECTNAHNATEIEVVIDFLEKLKKKGVLQEDIAIVVHHRQQKSKLTKSLKEEKISIPVNTVDSFQGMEAKVVLVLTTKTCKPTGNPKEVFHFVSDFNRETVAVSRAQHAVYLFGQWDQLMKTEFWSKFAPSIVEHRALVTSDWKEADQKLYKRISAAAESA